MFLKYLQYLVKKNLKDAAVLIWFIVTLGMSVTGFALGITTNPLWFSLGIVGFILWPPVVFMFLNWFSERLKEYDEWKKAQTNSKDETQGACK